MRTPRPTDTPPLNLRVSDWLGMCFWIGATLSAFMIFVLGVRNDWLTVVTFFLAYILGAVGGLLTVFAILSIPSARQRYEGEGFGTGFGLSYLDIFVPYLIVGMLASLVFVPLACKHPRFPAARNHPKLVRTATSPSIRQTGATDLFAAPF